MFEIDVNGMRRPASNYLRCFAYLTHEACAQSVKHSADICYNACRDCPVFIAGDSETGIIEDTTAKCGLSECETIKEISEFDQNYH